VKEKCSGVIENQVEETLKVPFMPLKISPLFYW